MPLSISREAPGTQFLSRRRLFPFVAALLVPALAACLGVALIVLHIPVLYVLGGVVGAILAGFALLNPLWSFYLLAATFSAESLLGFTSGLTATKLLGGLTIFSWLIAVLMGREFRPPRAAVLFVAPAFLLWGLVSLLAVERLSLGIGKLTTIALLLVLVFVTASVVRSRRDAERLAWVLLITTLISVQYGILHYSVGASASLEGLSKSRNSIGLFIAMCVPLVVYFYARSRLPVRICLIAVGAMLLLGEVLSYSRGGFILFLTALLLSFLLLARGSRVRLGLQMAALVMLSFYAVPDNYMTRLKTIVPSVETGTDTMGLRYQLWGISVRMIRDHPILGVGPGNYLQQFMRYGGTLGLRRTPLVSHNSYLSVSVELGLVGGALFIIIILVSLLTFLSVRRRALASGDLSLAHLSSSFAISLVLFAICGTKGSLEDFKYLWMLFGLSAAMAGILARQEPAAAPLSPQ